MRAHVVAAAAGAVVTLALTPVAWANRDSDAGDMTMMDGAYLFAAKGCSTCHVGPGSTTPMEFGPSLASAPEWAASRREGMTADEYIEESIRSPGAFISPVPGAGGPVGSNMPALPVNDAEIQALVDYLLQR